MKGLVTETKDGYCAILREDGAFVRIKGTYEVGAEIELDAVQTGSVVQFTKRRFKTAVAAAAAALAVLAGVKLDLVHHGLHFRLHQRFQMMRLRSPRN